MSASEGMKQNGHMVSLAEEDRRQVARLLAMLLGKPLEPHSSNSSTGPVDHPATGKRALLAARARAVFIERRRRLEHFSPAMFGEPAWDMLLVVYMSEYLGDRLTLAKLTSMIGAPHTTALRWLAYLEKERLIERCKHDKDRRRMLVRLLDRGRDSLEEFLKEATSEIDESSMPFIG